MSTQGSSYAPKSPDLSSFYSSTTTDIPNNPNPAGGYPFQARLGVVGVGVGVGPGPIQGGLAAGPAAGPAAASKAPLRYGQPQPRHQYIGYQSPTPPPLPPPPPPPPPHALLQTLAQFEPLDTAATYDSITATDANNNTVFSAYPPRSVIQEQHQHQHQQHHQHQHQHYHQGQYYSPQQHPRFPHTDQPSFTLQNSGGTSYYPTSHPESALPAAFHQPPQAQPSQFPTSQPPATRDQSQRSDPHSAMPPRKIAPAAKQNDLGASPVRTKFPTARIKRIMQADEEVGKVAQQTPIAVGKALELFMVQLVRKSADVAREKNSKRITAQMLKQAIDSTNEWDFLRDIVAKVGEDKEGGRSSTKGRAETESDEEAEGGEVKKKGRGGRKKKAPA
ncbi:hypothetical protein AAE478_002995 [Parahypoxylon ruwenzoriense]